MTADADVVIVGAGLAGLSAAVHLPAGTVRTGPQITEVTSSECGRRRASTEAGRATYGSRPRVAELAEAGAAHRN
jgi:glycine/D-amino acid oxidase-like deaminating enzyme